MLRIMENRSSLFLEESELVREKGVYVEKGGLFLLHL